jgi:hypothetical protein
LGTYHDVDHFASSAGDSTAVKVSVTRVGFEGLARFLHQSVKWEVAWKAKWAALSSLGRGAKAGAKYWCILLGLAFVFCTLPTHLSVSGGGGL